jgi:hypothetical protein
MSMNEDQLRTVQRSARLYQEQHDNALCQIGFRAPQPTIGQMQDDYRRETLRTIKKQFLTHHPLHRINMRGLDASVLPQFEQQVLQAAVSEAHNPKNVPLGELHRIDKRDETGVLKEICWVGQESFVKEMNRPGRRVLSFTTDQGRFDAKKWRWF